ncbi:hypothetical protein EM849_00605 [Bifidobacterium tissieri]|nr:hypothetical protein EM849_00605 [Bifidobacterium tissieri]
MAQNTEARRYSIPCHGDLAHYADSTGKHIPYHDPVAENAHPRSTAIPCHKAWQRTRIQAPYTFPATKKMAKGSISVGV